ncbi:MAG: DUF3467 domain-containing protein [Candidatus Moraniibacteriota bacterium]
MDQPQPNPSSAHASGGQTVQIKASDEMMKGEYSNMMQVMHTKEEFVMDFLNIFPPTGTLNSRVIVSPSHMKRIVAALADNLKKYEAQFGSVAASEGPSNPIGFSDKRE